MSKSIVFALLLFVVPVLAQIPTARQEVLDAQRSRPQDPWPRAKGHVVLALPGTLEIQKAYHEPGGSFSPEVGSFGVSLWVTDRKGAIVRTSDSIEMADLKQSFVWHPGQVIPSIRTETSDYETEWSVGQGVSRLRLTAQPAPENKLMLVVRSVGPAGSPIESLSWHDGQLRVNGRYSLRMTPFPSAVYVGPEGPEGWTTAQGPSRECRGQDGWCYVRLELGGRGEFKVDISDAFWRPIFKLPVRDTRATFGLELPDRAFVDSLNAQATHVLMSLVEDQVRPAEPINSPLAWLRDGSYIVVALARAGQLETARALVPYFAEKDFFGGFGAEGDSLGLSLWAIGEVASRVNSRDFDMFLWPHVHRKAEFILGLMSTQEPIERVFVGSLVPKHLARPDIYEIAEPPHDGLIMGRMDLHFPALYVTAVNYAGLESAADVADRIGAAADAERWRSKAALLKEAWNRNYSPSEPKQDERTFISGLWPTWIAAPSRAAYTEGLDKQWNSVWEEGRGFREIPLWTYFSFATAHNLLMLDQTEKTWQTLHWFWDRQPSPGLYSWWEGNGEENNFHEWLYVRGWVKPPHVTPHYWAAAECLLLQIDMLTYVDESQEKPIIVIGGGIPASWCSRPMKVRGVMTKFGIVDWTWDGKAVHADVRGERLPVRLGSGFPKNASVRVEYAQD